MLTVHIPDLAEGDPQDPDSQQYAQFTVCQSLGICQLYRCLSVLVVSEDLAYSNSYLEILLATSVQYVIKQIQFFNENSCSLLSGMFTSIAVTCESA